MKGSLLALLVMASMTHLSQRAFDTSPLQQPDKTQEVFPSLEALRFVSLTYPSLVADYYWLRAISTFGDARARDRGYTNLLALTERVLSLDPYFAAAYFFAGTALTSHPLDPRKSIHLLELGVEHRPDDWLIAYLLGFNAYYFAGDIPKAAHAMAHAATLPGASPLAGPLATRMAAEAGEPEMGLEMISTVMAGIKDEALRKIYEERRAKLRLEVELKWLSQAAAIYEQRTGRRPRTLQEMVQQGSLKSVPRDPLGGEYFLDATGAISTTSEKERLRLNIPGAWR